MIAVGSEPRSRARRIRWAILLAVLVLIVAAFWFRSRSGLADVFGKQYEYEEDLTIALDGTATLTVNASLAALVALRGLDLDPFADTLDRERVRAAYDSSVARVIRIPRPWTRRGRLFVQINLDVADIRRLHEAPPFAWSRYELAPHNGHHVFRQAIGPSAFRAGTLKNVGWSGGELVAFRVHFPSRIVEHNARDLETNEPTGILRGNILAWEQHLADRLEGREIRIEVRMESQSILYRTLWLFFGAFAAAVLTLIAAIWWVVRRGRRTELVSG